MRALARREQHVREAREDVNHFIEYVMKDEHGQPLKQGRIHREWQYYAALVKRLMIVAPRHHGKTQQSQGLILFRVGKDPNELIKLVCASDKKAKKRLGQIRKHCKSNDDLHRVFPHLHIDRALEWNKHMVTFERTIDAAEPTIEALGITSSGTGDRASGLVVDDGVDRRNSITLPKTREQIKESWDDWYNLLSPTSWLLWICTLWHAGDLTHDLMANPEYRVLWYEINQNTLGSLTRYPCGTEYRSEEPLWPEYWSVPRLAERKRVLKKKGFARSFSNRPVADSERKIDAHWIRPWKQPPTAEYERVMILDLAESQEVGADPVGGVILAVHPKKQRIKVEDAWSGYYQFTEKVRMVRTRRRDHGLRHIAAENSAGAISLRDHLAFRYRIPLTLIPTQGKKKSIWMDEAGALLEAGIVEFNPLMIEKSAEGGTNELADYGDPVAEILNLGSYPTDDIADAFSRGIFFVTCLYEVFDGELEIVDDEIPDEPFAVWADDDDDDTSWEDMPDDPDCSVLLI